MQSDLWIAFKMSDCFSTLNLHDSRIMLQFKLSMIPTVRNNFKNDKKYKTEGFYCQDCEKIGILNVTDTQTHLLTAACEANSDLRLGRNFDKNEDICAFFRDLITRRQKRDEDNEDRASRPAI